MRIRFLLAAAGLVFLGSLGSSQGAISFFVNDPVGFAAGVAGNGSYAIGTETFENNTIPAGAITSLTGPLRSGVANGVFPSGLSPVLGLTVQANSLGGNPSAPSGGTGLLAAAAPGFLSAPSSQVSNNAEADSLDLILQITGDRPALAVRLTPLYFNSAATTPTSHSGNLTVRVYSPANVLLNSTTLPAVQFDGADFLGITATDGDEIGRINLWDGNAQQDWQGADDIQIFIPEPGCTTLLAVGFAGLLRRRKKGA